MPIFLIKIIKVTALHNFLLYYTILYDKFILKVNLLIFHLVNKLLITCSNSSIYMQLNFQKILLRFH